MKTLLLLVPIILTGCEVLHNPGIQVYQVVHGTNKYGPSEKTAKVISINADVPGLSEVPTPYGPIRIAQVSGQNVVTTTNKDGSVVVSQTTILGGLAVTDHVKARGEADRFRIKETSAGVSGALISAAALGAAAPLGTSAIGVAKP